MKPKEIPLEEGKFYHIYNRGNNGENLFYSLENYEYFLKKYTEYLSDFVDTYTYCLMPNHFHLLVSVKEVPIFKKVPTSIEVPPFEKVVPLKKVVALNSTSLQFRKFFTSYSMSINKQENRTGSLFQKNFKRIEITSVDYLTNLIFYIHANPQLHGKTDDFKKYKWSSYNSILSGKPTNLKREIVIRWFDDKKNFVAYHNQKAEFKGIQNLILEE